VRHVVDPKPHELARVQVGVERPVLEELLDRLGERLPAPGRPRCVGAVDFRPAEIELEVERAAL